MCNVGNEVPYLAVSSIVQTGGSPIFIFKKKPRERHMYLAT